MRNPKPRAPKLMRNATLLFCSSLSEYKHAELCRLSCGSSPISRCLHEPLHFLLSGVYVRPCNIFCRHKQRNGFRKLLYRSLFFFERSSRKSYPSFCASKRNTSYSVFPCHGPRQPPPLLFCNVRGHANASFARTKS